MPLADASFSLVVCKALLEHVRYPYVAIQELGRVVKPGGMLIGDLAFLQPYHKSYYHMTHAATADLLHRTLLKWRKAMRKTAGDPLIDYATGIMFVATKR
jgi:ubiquinone/menaquinone biosynthesis C-methylase UbiE